MRAATRNALTAASGAGVPGVSPALYARWRQLETWLRSLVHVELRAAFGTDHWVGELPDHTDADATLAYTDARALNTVIAKHWDLFAPSLLARAVWAGRFEELMAIRNRIGHCRRAHPDDLGRLEQTLRDLEAGARTATLAYNEQSVPRQEDWEGPGGPVGNAHARADLLDDAAVHEELQACASRSVSGSPFTRASPCPACIAAAAARGQFHAGRGL